MATLSPAGRQHILTEISPVQVLYFEYRSVSGLQAVCDVIMDYCNSVKLLLCLVVKLLLWRTATVSRLDAEIGEIHYLLFQLASVIGVASCGALGYVLSSTSNCLIFWSFQNRTNSESLTLDSMLLPTRNEYTGL